MSIIWILVAILVGGLLHNVLGWSNSNEKWDMRKAIGTIVMTIITAASLSLAYTQTIGISFPDIISAFLAGAGGDALRKDIADAARPK